MDKEKLEQKFAEILGINESESSFAFNKFKEKVVEKLLVGEALKIKDLGVFQIKEQLGDETNKSKSRKKTLLFSPVAGIASEDSLFLTLNIQQKFGDAVEFDEGIFQLGIGKPMIKLDDDQSNKNVDKRAIQIENKIDELILHSERIQNYDIWEDYLEGKESKSILDDEVIKDELDSYFDDDLDSKSKQLFENDFEELDEDEIFNEIMNEGNLSSEELNNLTSDEEKNSNLKIDLEPEIIEETFEDKSAKTNIEEFENISENIEEEILTFKEDKIENIPKDEFKVEIREPEISNQEEIENYEKTIVDENEIEEEDLNLTQTDVQEKNEIDMRSKIPKRRNKTLINTLIGLFIVVSVIGIYFLFLANPTWLYDEHEVEVALSEQNQKLKEIRKKLEDDEKISQSQNLHKIPVDTAISKTVEIKQDSVINEIPPKEEIISKPVEKVEQKIEKKILVSETKSVKNERVNINTSKTQIVDADPNEKEVADNIYSIGSTYSVQVSSWKQAGIAEREVNKLKSKGFDAFVAKVYIPKFNGTWHRVRIGPYSTLEEAKTNQSKL
ncbi:MAG: SPOR domain-containing protein [Melioribacteraceae bacterium]